ncbi:RdgB/HAM1 family non-canonical purine NTP pyrophosphatase [Lacibacter luteus]|uniref:dITP/XTP pyrophosphatase n=1 Tax=Lacibacter luteus TaxID=2508719 RepID=A0A4Q1CFM2_9BACT|nr:RdgB/HAM1 family non-canonical purine NTP pyrophosphatase [Lacibacter luteus]RXK58759.1 RdgB/HAM1 family non-canonical purine NTP pyrophosphatase [Lacibacter luteus]
MQQLIFASGNRHKAEEIEAALPAGFRILIMKDAGITEDIPEPFDTLEENSKHKADFLYNRLQQDCFAEDTGLEVETLNGEPSVKSARYAGEGRDFDANIEKLLTNLEGKANRRARFRTVFSLIRNGKLYQFEGICNGTILENRTGTGGFGYDPVFLPDGSNRSFAEMTMAEKNQYSHRKKGLDKMIQFLQQ